MNTINKIATVIIIQLAPNDVLEYALAHFFSFLYFLVFPPANPGNIHISNVYTVSAFHYSSIFLTTMHTNECTFLPLGLCPCHHYRLLGPGGRGGGVFNTMTVSYVF